MRRALGAYAVAVYAVRLRSDRVPRAVQLQRQPGRRLPHHGIDDPVVQRGVRRLRASGRVLDLARGRAAGDRGERRGGHRAAFPLARARLRFRNAIRLAVTLPIMLPGLLIGISLLILLGGVLASPPVQPHRGDRPVHLHDAVRDPARGRAATAARPSWSGQPATWARARGGGSSMSFFPALMPACSRARCSRSRSPSTSSSSRCS